MKSIITNNYCTYQKMCKDIRNLSNEYYMLSVEKIGKSVMGKDIFSLSIGEGAEQVLFAAAFHGSEHITANIALKFAEEVCHCLLTDTDFSGVNLKKALKGRKITIIPMVNPDGCDISILGESACFDRKLFIKRICNMDFSHYNANARGVDINHNFNAGWEELKLKEKSMGISGPAKTRFGGNSAESEPETTALVTFCRNNNIHHATALHTQGEVIYWDYGENTPKRSKKMAEIMAAVSGYALDIPLGIATGGGFKDWFINEFSRPGFTLELGLGENPLPKENTDKIYQKCKEMLILNAIM